VERVFELRLKEPFYSVDSLPAPVRGVHDEDLNRPSVRWFVGEGHQEVAPLLCPRSIERIWLFLEPLGRPQWLSVSFWNLCGWRRVKDVDAILIGDAL